MSEMLTRLRGLPTPLLDGRLTHCSVSVVRGRIRFREPDAFAAVRQRVALRRRGLLGLLTGAAFMAMLALPGNAGLACGIIGSVLFLAAIDGIRTDLGPPPRPYEYAVLDAARGEVDLHSPSGWVMTARLDDVHLFLLVADPRHRQCHVGLVLERAGYLPWLTTGNPAAAEALTWLFGYLCQRPAVRYIGGLPLPPDWVHNASQIEPPAGH
jgi:hypothetical protein